MNRFLTRRRAKDGGDILSKGKKGKKSTATRQPEFDLDTVLPSTENFRTSLLLPNLSARFSMLREQDDPTSLLGKASDDSVLHPKRASRLPDFGYASGLSDIAEVSSFSSLVKPPFSDQRVGSMASTNGSAADDGSTGTVMNRSRAREGNNLFGGRQKTFKVSVSTDDESTARGKISFDDDPWLSAAYHRPGSENNTTAEEKILMTEEKGISKEDTLPEDAALALLKFDDDGSTEFSNSPSSEYQGKRATSSTSSLNSSGPSYTRASTAATSVASQGANSIPPSPAFGAVAAQAITSASGAQDKPMARSKRLYEHSLDQHYHEQQNLVLNKLNSSQKQRSASAKVLPSLGQPKFYGGERSISATALDRPSRATPLPPPPMAKLPELNTFDIGNNQNQENNMLPVSSAQSAVSPLTSPISPFADLHENGILTGALEPGDRGKATALGAFNKPKPFDEQQYLERQKQMQQRTGPSSHVEKERTESVFPVAENEPIESSPNFLAISPQSAVLPLTSPTLPTFSMGTYKTRSAQSGTSDILASDQKAKSNEGRDFAQPKPIEFRTGEVSSESLISALSSTRKQHEAQAEADADNSEQASLGPVTDKNTRNSRPAAASSNQEPEASWTKETTPSSKSHIQRFEADRATDIQSVVDSPTLGPGLSGLVKQHLRNVSNVSSVYSVATVAGMTAVDSSYPMPALDDVKLDIPLHPSNDQSNTWNNDDSEVKFPNDPDGAGLAKAEKHVDALNNDQADALDEPNSDAKPSNLSTETTQQPKGEAKKKHNRDGSTETQHERKAFANELINRQRQIQENLRNRTQLSSEDSKKDRAPHRSESRSGSRVDSKVLEHNSAHSPALGMSAPLKAWSAIRSVGRDSANSTTKETSSKAIKGHGSGGSSPIMSNTSLASMDKQREIQQPDSRRPSDTDGATTKFPKLSEGQRPSDLPVIDDGKARHHRPRKHTMPYRARGRLPPSDDTNGQPERNNQSRRGQSEGPQAPRARRPTMIKAETDGRDRAFSESDPSGFPQHRYEDLDLNGKHFNRIGLQKSVLKTAPLPSKAGFPFVKSPAPNGSNNETIRVHSSASTANKATGRPPRSARTGVQPGFGSQRVDPPNFIQPAKEIPLQGDAAFPATSTDKSPVMSPGVSTASGLPSMRTIGLPTGSRNGKSPIAEVPNPGFIPDSSPSLISPAAPATTTPLSMAIKSGNVTPTSQSASASPSTAALVPPDLPTVPIRPGSGGPPRKRLVNKIEISDPTFVSSTSTVETVTLEFARQNQSEFPASIPEIHTGRRQTEPFAGGAALSAPQSPLNGQLSPGEQLKGNYRIASAPAKPMKRLRHVLSEGHGLYGKARHQQQQQKQQRQTLQSQQGSFSKSSLQQPMKPEPRSIHVTGGAIANQRPTMPAAITVTENGMF